MNFRHLLAKSADDSNNPRPEETLLGHTKAVIEATSAFNEVLTDSIVSIMGNGFKGELWCEALFCSAWLHDLGKANDHFQKMIRNNKFRQGIRHESLGIVVVAEFLTSWLDQIWLQRNYPKWFWAAILYAISGHHLKFPDNKERRGLEVCFMGKHPQVKELLKIGKAHFGFDHIPELQNQSYSLTFGGISETLNKLRRELDSDFSLQEKLFIAMLKSSLICCDVAGSALPDKIEDKEQNIQKWLEKRIMPVLQEKQLQDVVRQKLKGATPRAFQEQVRDSICNTVLVEAGCGSGKTAAAYLWAARKANGKRLFFCYPTTATASEGFAGYLQDPDFEAILVNSRAKVDYRLLENLPPRTKSQVELMNLQLEALETWPIPAVVCTVHTVLGILQNVRRGIFTMPSLVRSAFVFDEIHSYSGKLFLHLLRFLEIFSSVPVLMMTATLPPIRKKALEGISKKRGGLYCVEGPIERENAKRYLLQQTDKEVAWGNVYEILNNGGKVLWVCNTVQRAMDIVEKAIGENLPVQPFHSRYRYKDRLIRQRELIKGFSEGKPALLAVTTQVAEMSLDLSADLLITEYAPIAFLIQRLGRLNRFDNIPFHVRLAIFIKPPDALPYAKNGEEKTELWNKIEAWLEIVADGRSKSQRELAYAFVLIEERDTANDEILFCDWIDDPATTLTNRKSLMEAGYTIDVVRQEDMTGKSLDEMVLPMPFPKGTVWHSWERKGRYFIAPTGTIKYNSFEGGKYAENQSSAWII